MYINLCPRSLSLVKDKLLELRSIECGIAYYSTKFLRVEHLRVRGFCECFVYKHARADRTMNDKFLYYMREAIAECNIELLFIIIIVLYLSKKLVSFNVQICVHCYLYNDIQISARFTWTYAVPPLLILPELAISLSLSDSTKYISYLFGLTRSWQYALYFTCSI